MLSPNYIKKYFTVMGNQISDEMVEIFRTNVRCRDDANKIIAFFLNENPCYKTNFDLQDEDKVFRVETQQKDIGIEWIINSMIELGYSCERIE